jgi:hypothetical protein
MKKRIVGFSLSFTLIALILVSCECDEENTTEELLIGKWNIQFLHIIASVDNVYLGDSTAYWNSGDAWIEFKDDKTGHTYIKDTEDHGFTWSIEGEIVKYMVSGQPTINMTVTVGESQLAYHNKMREEPYEKDPSKTYREEWYIWAEKP